MILLYAALMELSDWLACYTAQIQHIPVKTFACLGKIRRGTRGQNHLPSPNIVTKHNIKLNVRTGNKAQAKECQNRDKRAKNFTTVWILFSIVVVPAYTL